MLPFQAIKGGVYIAVMLTSLAVAYLMNLLIKKTGATWLGNFTMAFTLIIGMASSLFWLKVF